MKCVYAHFPINAICAKDESCVDIKNFLGGKQIKHVDMIEGVKDELVLKWHYVAKTLISETSKDFTLLFNIKEICSNSTSEDGGSGSAGIDSHEAGGATSGEM